MKLARYLILFFLGSICVAANAQYTTISNGSWNNPAIWNLGSIPTSASGSITVNHNVTIPSGYILTIDETTVNGTLTINSGGQLTLADGTGVDLTMNASSSLIVNGDFIRNNLSTLTQNVTSIATFGAASSYHHKYQTTEGAPPLATWNAASNFYLEGFANTSILDMTSSSWNQSFGNFIYNCAGQKSIVSFNGLITSIQGNLSFLSTGTNVVRLTDNEVNVTISVAGDFTVSGTARVNFSEDGTGGVLNLTGNFIFNSSSSLGSYFTNTGSFTANVSGNFSMTATAAGKLYMASSGGSTGTSTLNLYKNFSLTSGTITESGTGTANGNIRFVGNGNFTLANTGSVLNWINWYISPTVTLDLGTSPISAGTSSTFTLDAGATLVCGSLEPTGAIRTTTTVGNIRTPNVGRNYVSGSTVIYRSPSAQFMGDGQPSGSGITTIIDNGQGVTLYQGTVATLTINGTLQLQSGMLFIGARTLSLTGTVTYGSGTFGGSSSSVLLIGGTSGGSLGTLTFESSNNTLGTLTMNRTGINGSIDVNATLTVVSQLNLTNGSINNNSGLSVGNGCVLTRYPTGFLLVNRLSHGGNLYDVTYKTASAAGTSVTFSTALELPLATDATALNNFIISTNQMADVVNLSQDVTANGDISFNKGNFAANTFTITMKGTTWSDNAGTFVPGTGTVVFSGITTLTGTGTPILGNVQLTSGNTLTIGKNSNISGDIDFQSGAIFDPSTFTITLNGSALQTLSPNSADFFNLTVAKSGGNVQLTSAMNLVSVLKFSNPSINCSFQSNGLLTLVSTGDSVGTATVPLQGQIYRLASGNAITGDVIVQRYMSGEGRIYRYLSSPVSNATVASWKDDFAITGTFTDPSSGQTICGTALKPSNPSMYYYDESQIGGAGVGYVNYPSSGLASSNPLIVGRGYAAFIRQCSTPTVVDVVGPVNQGTITFGITYTNTGDASADGYNLVGNPYPCTVDWDAGWTKTRLSNVISTKDNGTGVMLYWDGTTGGITNGEIAVGQGFWIRATSANPVLKIGETAKVITPNQAAEFFRQATPNVITIALSDGKIKDKAYIKMRTDSKNTIDDWDAPKLNNDLFDLYTLSEDSIAMAINSYNNISCTSSFVLGIKDMSTQSYTLSVENLLGIFEQYGLTLIDNYTGQTFPFTSPYQFTVDSNPLSASAKRFMLQIGPKIPDAPIQLDYQNVLCQNTDASVKLTSTINSVNYQLVNAHGQLVSSVTGNGGELSLNLTSDKLTSGVNTFVVKSVSSCNTTYESKDVQITVEEIPNTFATSDSTNCGAGSVTLKAGGVPSNYTINWFATSDSQEVLFSGFAYQTPSINKSSTYYALAVSPGGCSSPRIPAMATIVSIDTPIITDEGSNVLSVNSSGDLQWAFNGSPIVGATGSSITADKSGIYSVTINENGCSASAERQFAVTGIEKINSEDVVLFPNPVEHYLYVRNESVTISDLSFIDNIGKVRPVKASQETGQIKVDMEDFSAGIYYLQIIRKGKSDCYKIIKK
jgi:hypothetical protein